MFLRAIDYDGDSYMKNYCNANKWLIIELSQVRSCVWEGWMCVWKMGEKRMGRGRQIGCMRERERKGESWGFENEKGRRAPASP